jgi:diguanylate cyclase (GGDEF)-like protein
MNDIANLLAIVRDNETIAAKFHNVETKILSILNFKDFFEVLLTEIRTEFNMPCAWLSLIENTDASKMILKSIGPDNRLFRDINMISEAKFKGLVGSGVSPVLINRDIKQFFRFLPAEKNFLVRSMAIAPVTLDGQVIGSLNQADSSQERFEPGIDTGLLEMLALKISLCISNVIAHEKLKFLAYHDPLTGLLNRRVMESVLNREFERAIRYKGHLSLVFIDIDQFKSVNDTHGHNCGDLLLRYVSETLSAISRDTDVVARYAGDEFIIILPETGKGEAEMLLNRANHLFKEKPMQNDAGIMVPVSISYGISSLKDDNPEGPEQLIKKADERLYLQKKAMRI